MTLDNLQDLYIEQLRDIYSAESQLVDALQEMAQNASNRKLKDAFNEHLEETRQQKQRLEQVFNNLGERPTGETCEAMQGLIQEAQELLEKDVDEDVLDAGLIAAAQRVEHYEIAAYGTVRTYAQRLGREDDANLLEETLAEEKEADKKLTQIAEQVVNPEAANTR